MELGGDRSVPFWSDLHTQRSGSETECDLPEELTVFQQDSQPQEGKLDGWSRIAQEVLNPT